MQVLYSWTIRFYLLFIHLAAWVHPKAREWVTGRRNWRDQLSQAVTARRKQGQRLLWVHCASLGEFEQGRPLIESLKQEQPGLFLLLSFYSPSGFEIRKNYPFADAVVYLPPDTPARVRTFLDLTSPDLVVFVKYEFWFNFLDEIRKRAIPAILISARFRKEQHFFRPYGTWFRKHLGAFRHIFTQDESSAALLEKIQRPCTLAGDTRVDRVLQIAQSNQAFPAIEAFVKDHPVLIAGSTWPPDEKILSWLLKQSFFSGWKLIVAPHDISESHLEEIERILPAPCTRFTCLNANEAVQAQVLLIDNIGMLSALYRYGRIAYIGGAFGRGLHNTLEPIVFRLPVIFGPRYSKFQEAVRLVQTGGAQAVESAEELGRAFQNWTHPDTWQIAADAAYRYIEENQGATHLIANYLREHFPWLLEK